MTTDATPDRQLWLRLAKEFTDVPGPRLREEGDYSGEEFRQEYLEPRFKEALDRNVTLFIDLDGVEGYATSFLEEAFGGLTRLYSDRLTPDDVTRRIEFKSDEVRAYIDECRAYIREANDKK